MQFTTQIPIQAGSPQIDYNSRILSLGSCFAVNMGQKLDYFKFRNSTNPFGILFHPQAIETFISHAVNQKEFTEADIFYHNERWHCFDAHSDLSSPDKDTILHNLNHAILNTAETLKNATHVIITLGTAWVYRNTASSSLVANCHKVPQKEFDKELLPVEAIQQSLKDIINLIAEINNKATIIFTISPVRHIKDGFTENQRSKAHLITALHTVLNTEHRTLNTAYFPAYEIMMDELRDYRFYTEDLVHPSLTAINYIWERFAQAWVSPASQPVMKEADAIQKSLLHRPYNPDGAQYIEFKEKLSARIQKLQQQHPHIQF
ncbi:GSCFA domain-containing protein [Flavobacterium akiainvivens]|uniref:GSCFA domain-containing protein n=1 Tax=Flavobacterium akiainvivens TaxID=1202724 RepID=A0A0M8MBQ7_9FLAO|nr:GSCFA domain-containing protein [Flavobacterium akiainvivens]KOS07833.1 GSCFA domain-containing protein [Flavobacterium akiainvivens]SFQ27221.1 GSCFA family protein [Flavobacterium akiainvivens]